MDIDKGLSRFLPEKMRPALEAKYPSEYLDLLKAQGAQEVEASPVRNLATASSDGHLNVRYEYRIEFRGKSLKGRSLAYNHRVHGLDVSRYDNPVPFRDNPNFRSYRAVTKSGMSDATLDDSFEVAALALEDLGKVIPGIKTHLKDSKGEIDLEKLKEIKEAAERRLSPITREKNSWEVSGWENRIRK